MDASTPPVPQPVGKLPLFFNVRSSKWFILMTIMFAVFTDIFLYAVVVPVLPFALSSRVGVAQENVQLWVSILLATYAFGLLGFSPIAGYFADHSESRRLPFMVGLIAMTGANILLCMSSSLTVLVVGRLLQGMAAAVVWAVGFALVPETVGQDKAGEAIGLVSLGLNIGTLIGPTLGGLVFANGGYYAVFAMTFALLGVDIVLRVIMIERKVAKSMLGMTNTQSGESDRLLERDETTNIYVQTRTDQQPTSHLPPVITLLKSPRFLTALWGIFALSTMLSSFDGVLPLFVHHTFGWNADGAGLIFLCLCAPAFLEPLVGRLSDKYGVRWFAVGGFAAALPSFVLLRFVQYDSLGQVILLCGLLVLIGVSISVVMTPVTSEVTNVVYEKERETPGIFGKGALGQGYALMNMAFAAGSLVGPLWSGLIIDTAGWGILVLSLGLLSIVSVVPSLIWSGGPPLIKHKVTDVETSEGYGSIN